jgi:hypothetical protein
MAVLHRDGGLPGGWSGVRLDLGFVLAAGARGLGGQEQGGQQGPGRGDGAGHDSADGQAVQERIGRGVLEGLAGGRMAAGRELARSDVGRADRLVREARDRAGRPPRGPPGAAARQRTAGRTPGRTESTGYSGR